MNEKRMAAVKQDGSGSESDDGTTHMSVAGIRTENNRLNQTQAI